MPMASASGPISLARKTDMGAALAKMSCPFAGMTRIRFKGSPLRAVSQLLIGAPLGTDLNVGPRRGVSTWSRQLPGSWEGRHCERSEAIQSGMHGSGSLRRCAPRDDGHIAEPRFRVLALRVGGDSHAQATSTEWA